MNSHQEKSDRKRESQTVISEVPKKLRKKELNDSIDHPDLIFAHTSQADEAIFSRKSAGRQCFAMDVVWLMRASTKCDWSERTLNEVLIVGDKFYHDIVAGCVTDGYFPINGYLEPRDLNHLDPNVKILGQRWRIGFDDNLVSNK